MSTPSISEALDVLASAGVVLQASPDGRIRAEPRQAPTDELPSLWRELARIASAESTRDARACERLKASTQRAGCTSPARWP
jgi:hypothetical protein